MLEINRRDFLRFAGGFGLCAAQLVHKSLLLPARGASSVQIFPGKPLFDLPGDQLITISANELRIGTSIYPFRAPHRPDWILSECKQIGFNSIRLAYPRNNCQRGDDDGPYDRRAFRLPNPDISDLLRSSGMKVVMNVQGHSGDSKASPIEWPRNSDGSINGKAAAQSFANYTHWLTEETRDFVETYELWNEAFGHIDDQKYKMSFGPGGSKENADNYADMMTPALRVIRKLAPNASITIEGNYWNVNRSAGASESYQQLLAAADLAIKHPYGYDEETYQSKRSHGKESQFWEQDHFFRTINPNLKWCYTEYAPTASCLGVKVNELKGRLQAKGFLRATVLHMRHGITQLYPFAIYYPTAPGNTMIDEDGTRRPAWYAMQRFLQCCKLNKPAIAAKLSRSTKLPEACRDLAIATANGFTYCIWQETDPKTFINAASPQTVTVQLKASLAKPIILASVIDPLEGKTIQNIRTQSHPDASISITVPVTDYPLLCQLQV